MAAYSVGVISKIVEGWTDNQLEELGLDGATAEAKVGLHIDLIPLAELDTGIRRCR